MVKIEVRYGECDATGYAYNVSFFPWMDLGISHFYKNAGIYATIRGSKKRSFMTVHQSFDYKRPVTYGDLIEVKLFLINVGESSVHYQCEIYKDDVLIAVGNKILAYMDLETKKKVKLPDEIQGQLTKLIGVRFE